MENSLLNLEKRKKNVHKRAITKHKE